MLGDLTKLLEQGNLTDTCTVKTTDGSEYSFKLRTLTPLEDSECREKASKYGEEKYATYYMNCLLSLAIESINDTKLEEVPGATGNTTFERRYSIVSKLGSLFSLPLQKAYSNMMGKILIDDNVKEDELKK